MFKIFSYENIIETINKKPLVCFYTENGGCGTSGLFVVIFDDNSSYGYSTFYQKSDTNLIKEIMKTVPEFKPLIGYRDSDNTSKRQTYISEMSFAYLGLGNAAYINSDIYYEYEQLKKDEYSIVAFRKLVDKISDTSLGSMFLEVDKVLK